MMKKILFSGILTFIFFFGLQSQTIVKMQEDGGVYTMPCEVNGLKLRFIFDTGASDVSISLTEAIFMLKNGYLSEDDIIGSVQYNIANGDIEEGTTINLKKITIGDKTLHNVAASIVHTLNAPLLLGQSAIKKLGGIQINDDELIIMDGNPSFEDDKCAEAKNLINKAHQQYKNSFYDLSIDTYKKALRRCSDAFTCDNFFDLGFVFFLNNRFDEAEKYFEKTIICEIKDTAKLDFTYQCLGISQYHNHDYNKSKINLQKSLMLPSELELDVDCFIYLGKVEMQQKNYSDAIDYFNKTVGLIFRLNEINMEDVIKGKCDISTLASAFSCMAAVYGFQQNYETSKMYIVFAAQCGDKESQFFCNQNGIEYRKLFQNQD